MADITLSIPDARQNEGFGLAALALNYQAKVPAPDGNSMVPNPTTKKAFVKQHFMSQLKALIREGARKAATDAAITSADASVSDISVT